MLNMMKKGLKTGKQRWWISYAMPVLITFFLIIWKLVALYGDDISRPL